jgi:DNA-binding MurR/RpiR family transcriptional regulator
MESRTRTVAETLRLSLNELTPSERKLASVLLGNYPLAGLNSVAELGRLAGTSAPTVLRMIQKLGFAGFPEFQSSIRAEVEAQLSTPLTKREQLGSAGAPQGHILKRMGAAVIDNIRKSLELLDYEDFDQAVALLCDESRTVYVIGGRLTDPLADYLQRHLHATRPQVRKLAAERPLWGQSIVDMKAGDVLVIFDIRRYDRDLAKLAGHAAERGVAIVLFTDQWLSPIHKRARHTFALRIEAPSSWDSASATLAVVEALIAGVVDKLWARAEKRIGALEEIADPSGRHPARLHSSSPRRRGPRDVSQ